MPPRSTGADRTAPTTNLTFSRRRAAWRGDPLHPSPLNRAKTSRTSPIFCCRSLLEPERMASATHDSMWRPSRSFSTCSSAPWTAATCIRMSTQYASLSTIRWSPCTCPSIRRSRPRTLAFVSSLITPIPPGGSIPPRDRGVNSTGGGSRAVTGAGAVVTGSQVEERRLFRGRDGRAPRPDDALLSLRRPLPRRVGGRGPGELPPFLVGDAVALLDREEIDEPREGVREQHQVPLPVAR